ncbi:MAG: hypothetical protein GYA23_04425 [Methanomicrobiales archaeon]|nr:hypothetical protein [Methanomicrobiales archaeon]
MQIAKKTLIIPVALVGLYILYLGMRYVKASGFTGTALAVFIAGLALCFGVLVLTFREEGESIAFFRILITSMIGGGTLIIALTGIGGEPTSTAVRPYYAIFFLSIIILSIALWLAYRQYGHFDIKLQK